MVSTFADVVETLAFMDRDGKSPEKLVLSEESFDQFLTDDDFNRRTKETNENLSEWSLDIERGEEDVIVAVDGSEYLL